MLIAKRKQVKTILQSNMVECGAACLAMICDYYKINKSFDECIEEIQPSQNGTKAIDIVKTARVFGLKCTAFSIDLENLHELSLPAILHWKFNHFVVLETWSTNKIVIVDPAKGRKTVSLKEFDKSFTGVAISFERIPNFNYSSTSKTPSWKTYFKLLREVEDIKQFIFKILGASLILQLFGLALPFFTKIIIDEVLPFKISSIMPILAIGILLFITIEALISYIRSILVIHLRVQLDAHMMAGLFHHLLSLPYSFFQHRTSGDLVARLASNSAVRDLFTGQVVSTILDGSLVVVYLAILLWQAPFFGLIALFIGVLQILLIVGTNQKAKDLLQERLVADANLQAYQIESIRGITTLKASGSELNAFFNWKMFFVKQLNTTIKKDHFFTIIRVLKSALEKLTPLVLLWIGVYYVLSGAMSLGLMLALNALAIAFLTPLTSLATTGQRLQEGLAHLDRVMKIIEAKPEQMIESRTNAPLVVTTISGTIKLTNVYFRYNVNGAYVLEDLSIDIKPGEKVAIVGETGAGKSTLGNLLLGLYIPEKGNIEYDGIPIQKLNLHKLRTQFGVVLQDTFLFSGSIRQNIAFNNSELSLTEIKDACKKAAIHDEIMQMPMEYETIIAEGGLSLSGGQRQRLAIARALINQPKILLLDEASSHLDVKTEKIVQENLDQLKCTTIIIAHRLSTIMKADKIIVLHKGNIIETGTHYELIASNGIYADLVKKQYEVPLNGSWQH